jgi:hypothetical protein
MIISVAIRLFGNVVVWLPCIFTRWARKVVAVSDAMLESTIRMVDIPSLIAFCKSMDHLPAGAGEPIDRKRQVGVRMWDGH